LALTAIYASDATSWQLSLPPKALAANNGSKFYLKIVESQNVVLMSKKESNEEEIAYFGQSDPTIPF
jgi:hypothetical protein